jgi:hypothetical protein
VSPAQGLFFAAYIRDPFCIRNILVLTTIDGGKVTILLLHIGHRSEIY